MATVPSGREFTFPADTHVCTAVHAGVMEFVNAHMASEDACMEVDLAVQEALVNAVVHGCKSDASKSVYCGVFSQNDSITIVVRDPGNGFDPQQVPDPLSEKGRGGFSGRGVHLIQELMDEVSFARNGAEIRMRKSRMA